MDKFNFIFIVLITWNKCINLMFLSGFLVNGPYSLITTAVAADLGTQGFSGGTSRALATVTAINDEEHKSLESVAAQIKTTLLREKKAAMLREKMQGATLEEVAEAAGAQIESFADAKVSASYVQGLGIEPRVLGSFATVTAENKGQLLPLVDGGRGVYAVVVDEVVVSDEQTAEAERVRLQAEEEMKSSRAMWAIQEAANIVDNTVKFF